MEKYIGQEYIFDIFKKGMDSGKLAHAYLLCGDEGMGKKTLAKILASSLLCLNPVDGKRCGKCSSCAMVEANTHPDLCVVEDLPKKKIGVDDIRDAISEMYVKPVLGDKKVFVINSGDKFNLESQNCILKSLEEPPPYAVILITTPNVNGIIETVKSRCVVLSLAPYTIEEMVEILKGKDSDRERLIQISSVSRNNPGKALKLIMDREFFEAREQIFEVFSTLGSEVSSRKRVLDIFENLKEKYLDLFDVLETVFRDLLLYAMTFSEDLLINYDKKGMIVKVASAHSSQCFINCIEICEHARRVIAGQGNYLLSVDSMLIRIQEEMSA